MIQASDAYISAVNADGRTVLAQLLVDGQPIIGDITSVTISRGACGSQPLTGSIFVPSIEATIKGLAGTDLEGEVITAKIGLVTSRNPEVVEYVNAGSYVISKPQTSAGVTSINGVGTLSTVGMETAIVEHSDIAGVISDVESGAGVTVRLQGVTASGSLDNVPEGTWRDVMQEVALALNGFLTEDVDGNWTIAKFCSGSVINIPANRSQEAPRYDEQPYTLESMSVESGEVDMSIGNPLLDPWDVLNVTDIDGDTHLVPCLRITHTIDGGLSTNVYAEVETAIQEGAKIDGPVSGIVQHFWFDGAGAHVTVATKEEYLQDPASAGGNTLITSTGLSVRDGEETLASFGSDQAVIGAEGSGQINITKQAVSIKDFNGVEGFTFGFLSDVSGLLTQEIRNLPTDWEADPLTVELESEIDFSAGNCELNFTAMIPSSYGVAMTVSEPKDVDFYFGTGGHYRITVELSQITAQCILPPEEPFRSARVSLKYHGKVVSPSIDVGYDNETASMSATFGQGNSVAQEHSIAVGVNNRIYSTVPSIYGIPVASAVFGEENQATSKSAFACGYKTVASGYYSHSEGYSTTASGNYSHAEGTRATASGSSSHSEGVDTTASGDHSHAEGISTEASGNNSHAGGSNTCVRRNSQTAIGRYNEIDEEGQAISDYGKYAFMIGNGTAEEERSNAFTVDWDGNTSTAGDLTIGTDSVISDTQASSLSQTLKVVVPTGGAKSIILQRDDGTQDIRLHLSSAGNRGVYDNVTKDYLIYHDANDVLRMYTAPSLLGHNSPIGTAITNSKNNVSVATGGSLKGTGCSVTLPTGTWIIQYYVGWQNTNGGTYKGIGLRYRAVGTTSWTAMTRSNINVPPIQSDTAVHDALAGCVVVTSASTGTEYEINVRNNVAGTVNCDLRAVRLL